MFVIADIAGELNALMRLVERIPKGRQIVLVGDLIDRGPSSKEVVAWAIENKDSVITLKGNHEDMMLDWYYKTNIYDRGIWLDNGGDKTLISYGATNGMTEDSVRNLIPVEHMEFLASCPLYFLSEGAVVTHAPIAKRHGLITDALDILTWNKRTELSVLWNRGMPKRREHYQIFRHNSHWGLDKIIDAEGEFAICLDGSRAKKLTGILWPEQEIFQEDY